jgi:hypothetical protein
MELPMESEVIFVSYNEPEADLNFQRLIEFRPTARRISGIKGIGHAYYAAAEAAQTPNFFLLDADNWILDGFDFNQAELSIEADITIWKTQNAVNGLLHYNGGLKLLRREAVLHCDRDAVDIFMTMKGKRRFLNEVASQNRFNATPFQAFRTAFRECAKLSSGLHPVPYAGELLRIWCHAGAEQKNGIWSIKGARAGVDMGRTCRNMAMLNLINDAEYLKDQFFKSGGDEVQLLG